MKTRHVMFAIGFAFCSATSMVGVAPAQMPLPEAKPVNGAALFKQQCATCHTTDLSEPLRQGPPLVHIIGRQAGKFEGFPYSPALARADFTWDEEQARYVADQSTGRHSRRHHAVPAAEAGNARRHHRIPQGIELEASRFTR